MSIVREAQYLLKPESVKVKRYQRVIPSLANNPQTGYNMGDTIIFYIPGGLPNQLMDGRSAYLRFTLNVNSLATGAVGVGNDKVSFDYTASSIIRRLDIYGPGGALVSSTDRYNTLVNCLYDITFSESEMKGLSTLIGSDDGDVIADLNRHGVVLEAPSKVLADTQQDDVQFTFAIPLIAPIFSGCDKYIPTYSFSDDIRCEVTLETQVGAFYIEQTAATSNVTCTIRSPSIIVDFLELEPAATAQISSLYAGRDLVLHAEDWKTYETTVNKNTSGQWSTIIPSKVMSAKCALFAWRSLDKTLTAKAWSQSVRTNPFTGKGSTFNLSIGGQRVPGRPITSNTDKDVTEHFAELQKAFHALNQVEFSGSLPLVCYTSKSTIADTDEPHECGFLGGLNLDGLRGQSDVLLSGTDLSKVTTYAEASFVDEITANPLTLDTFIKHDTLLVINSTGTMVAKF